MYHEWQATKDANNASDVEPDDPEEEAIYNRMTTLEEQAAAFLPETMEDFAFKVIFADDDGDMSMNPSQRALAKLAYQMAGLTPGKWHRGFTET